MTDTLVVERSASVMVAGTPPTPQLDDLGQTIDAWTTLATVPGLIQPKTATEVAIQSQGGAEMTDTVVYLSPMDITAADRIHRAADTSGPFYEVTGVRDAGGHGHHLEVDARLVR
ncbi:MAG TPA: head-tail adaptor protein [Candidatus Limnocylindrales bacterium]